MRTLTETQIEQIAKILAACGHEPGALADDLLDHICSVVEHSAGDFDTALENAIARFGGTDALSFLKIQTRIALQHRRKVWLSRLVHRFKYGFATFLVVAAMFKLMHWPGANVLLLSAGGLGTAYLLVLFYRRKEILKMEKSNL